jgi:predicted DNA-binding transcriptional regulator AlpA
MNAGSYTVKDIAAILRVSRATVDRLGDKIPGRKKVGGQVRYVKSIVDSWWNDQGGKSEGENGTV